MNNMSEKIEKGNFVFVGEQVVQRGGCPIKATCKDSTEHIGHTRYQSEGRKLTREARLVDIGQMRSGVVGLLGWLVRQCRPDVSYGVSRHQGVVSSANIKDFNDINGSLRQAQQHSDAGCLTEFSC